VCVRARVRAQQRVEEWECVGEKGGVGVEGSGMIIIFMFMFILIFIVTVILILILLLIIKQQHADISSVGAFIFFKRTRFARPRAR